MTVEPGIVLSRDEQIGVMAIQLRNGEIVSCTPADVVGITDAIEARMLRIGRQSVDVTTTRNGAIVVYAYRAR
jgi:exosome complex RNA-binding protein Csl4